MSNENLIIPLIRFSLGVSAALDFTKKRKPPEKTIQSCLEKDTAQIWCN